VLLISAHATVLELVVAQAFLGAATGFFNPASSGLIPVIAGSGLQQANSLRGMAMAPRATSSAQRSQACWLLPAARGWRC
jgi:hypothetical protein